MAFLVAVEGPLKGKRFELQEGEAVIGRSFNADIRVDDLTVSRHHCKITTTTTACTIEDLGSGNGTIVNDEVIAGARKLAQDDVITLPSAKFRFETVEQRPSSVTLIEQPVSEAASIVETIDASSTIVSGPLALEATGKADVLAKANEQLRTVIQIANAVGRELQLDKLLDEIMDALFRVFPQVDRGFIMLKGDDTEELQATVARRRDGKPVENVTVSKRIIEEACRRRIAILSADAMGDQRFSAAMSVMNFQIRSMMCAPLVARDEVMGILHLDTSRQDKRFGMSDLELFNAVANQTALAIGNARMHERLLLRERTERDLALARRVQTSFLPGKPPAVQGMEFCAWYKAALQVGGDFYDFIPLADGRLGIVVGDVAGKGMPAALMMARMMSDVRFLALSQDGAGKVMAHLNNGVIQSGMDDAFVTAVFCVLDPQTRQLTLANAAHCPPIIRPAGTGELVEVQDTIGFPIGAVPDAEYEEQTITINPGDTITMFTDGITEAMNTNKDLFGNERVFAAMTGSHHGPQAVMDKLLEGIHQWVGDTPQSDDLTVVCFGAV